MWHRTKLSKISLMGAGNRHFGHGHAPSRRGGTTGMRMPGRPGGHQERGGQPPMATPSPGTVALVDQKEVHRDRTADAGDDHDGRRQRSEQLDAAHNTA